MASSNNIDSIIKGNVDVELPEVEVQVQGSNFTSNALVEMETSRALINRNSTAVVQFHPNLFPVQFHNIRLNTDLNRLPSGWSKSKFHGCGWTNASDNNFSSYTSLNLAHNHMDLVGKVDVISSSTNIKNLLKMPYQQAPQISLMVHRLGNTLLIEEFDVHKHLIKKDAENWQWLVDFYHRYVNKEEDKSSSLVPLHSPKKDPLLDELYRNLIRHSIKASVGDEENAWLFAGNRNKMSCNMHHMEEEPQDLKGFHHESLWKFHDRSMLVDSDLPIFGTDSKRPCISLRLRDSRDAVPINVLTGLDYWLDNLMSNVPEVAMVYHLNGVVQKYEVLRTEDIPNLSNSNFDPEEVMELARNVMAFIKSRAVVEGHTYWLYKNERDEMVKLYDLTEYCKKELRTYDNPFTVPVGILCYHVARNLKVTGQRRSADCRAMLENCLRLLIEEHHPRVCTDAHMLLSDMWVPNKSLHDIWQGDGRIADPPDDLYDEEDSSESDNLSFHPQAESSQNSEDKGLVEVQETEKKRISPKKSPQKKDGDKNEVALRELVVRGMIKRKAWDVIKVCRIAGETDERCHAALEHIRKGLRCIDNDLARKSKPKRKFKGMENYPSSTSNVSAADFERDNLTFAKPFVPIPLHYSPLKPNTTNNKENFVNEKSPLPSDVESNEETISKESSESSENNSTQSDSAENIIGTNDWHMELKLQLLRKAAIAFYILANQFHTNLQKRGHTLRYVRYGLHCYDCLFTENPKRTPDVLEEEVHFHLVYLAARARACLDYNAWAVSKKDFEELSEVEAAILHSAQSILQTPKETWAYKWPDNEEKNLRTTREMFKKLIKMKVYDKKPLDLRLAVKKQIAVCTLNLGHVLYTNLKQLIAMRASFESIEPAMEKCKTSYNDAIGYFLDTNDKAYAGLSAYSIARMYEWVAEDMGERNREAGILITKQENALLQKMFDACERTLGMYSSDEIFDGAKEEVHDLKRHRYLGLALRLHNTKVKDTKENVNEKIAAIKAIKDYLFKSLSSCFLDPHNPYFMKSFSVAGCVYYNLALFQNNELKNAKSDKRQMLRRKVNEDLHKSFECYHTLKWSRSMIGVMSWLVRNSLQEYDAKYPGHEGGSESVKNKKKKMLGGVMTLLHEILPAIELINDGKASDNDNSSEVVTYMDGLKIVLDLSCKIWMKIVKIDQREDLKATYRRILGVTKEVDIKTIGHQLVNILSTLKTIPTGYQT